MTANGTAERACTFCRLYHNRLANFLSKTLPIQFAVTKRVQLFPIIQCVATVLVLTKPSETPNEMTRIWIMAVATQTAPVFVQQAFQWDDAELASSFSSNGRAKVADSETTSNSTIRPSSRPAVTVPTFRTNSSFRRGRCEHVSGMLATVLERYGIGMDQLIAEIDRQK